MSVKRMRRIVVWLSVAVGVIGLIGVFLFRTRGVSVPLWDWLMLTYGGVVSVVLPMDFVGKQATRFRADADALKARPRPTPSSDISQRVAPVEVRYIPLGDVDLERVTPHDETALQALIDAAVTELAALENRRPELDSSGHVVNVSAHTWLSDRTVYPFFVKVRQQRCGCCVVKFEALPQRATVLLLYVDTGWRRRQVGRHVMSRLSAFLQLLTPDVEVQAALSNSNGRALRFFAELGYEKAPDVQPGSETDESSMQIWAKRHGNRAEVSGAPE